MNDVQLKLKNMKSPPYTAINDIPASAWETLSRKKIYFGHQSVGFNIIDGLKDLMAEQPNIRLNIVETSDSDEFKDGIFAHSMIGENADPIYKAEEFKKIMDDGIGSNADVAFFKYCYVDITEKTDINKVFSKYTNVMSQLKAQYPQTFFAHVTVPLRTTKTTWKTTLKKLMRKDRIWEYEDNIIRNNLNALFQKEYKEKEPLFNIASIESTSSSGSKTIFSNNGKTYYSMCPAFTNDGGHLNETGRKVVAEQLLLFLVNLDVDKFRL